MIKILIDNEEVVSNNNLQIKEEMLSTSSTILKNCYPKSWENDKDYVSRYYFPKDYSKCKITDDVYHPEVIGTRVSGTNFTINYNNTLDWKLEEFKGDTKQNGTPTPSSPVPIQSVTGLQNVNVCGKNLLDASKGRLGTFSGLTISYSNGEILLNGTSTSNVDFYVATSVRTPAYNNDLINYMNNNIGSYTLSNNLGYENYFRIGGSYPQNTGTTTSTNKVDLIFVRIPAGTYNNKVLNIQLEIGSVATEYEPYKGNTYEVNLGKNLYEGSQDFSGTWNNSSSWTTDDNTYNGLVVKKRDGTWNGLNKTINVTAGETYTFSLYAKSDSSRTADIYISTGGTATVSIPVLYNKTITTSWQRFSVTFTCSVSGTIKPRLENNSASSGNYTYICGYQLELGNATSYSPYFTPIELNKIGTYQDRIYKDNGKWYVEKHIQRIVINENTPGIYQSGSLTNTMRMAVPSGYTLINNTTAMYCDKLQVIANYSGDYEKIYVSSNNFYVFINKSRGVTNVDTFKTWLSTNNLLCYVVLATPTYTEITNTELINQLESIKLLKGINNISITSENLSIPIEIHYNFKEAWTEEELIFCGCVKNTGKISLNPRQPHYVDLQILDFKTLLSEGETLNYVITNKTIVEAINQVVNSISDYGFIVGNINIQNPDDIINAYSTLEKTAYDVFQYIADITQSKWSTRMIDENTIAIDFYDPTLMEKADTIENTEEYFEANKIIDISFNYSTNDYRNKQIMTSDEVYANITQTETLVADGYNKTFMCENKIGQITSITTNGTPSSYATKSEEEQGVSADYVYQPGEMTFASKNTVSTSSIIIITYYPIVKGREIVLNARESSRIGSQINRKGTISRYENRNDTTSSQELQKIGQSYIKYKGQAEITLKVVSEIDLFNIGQIVEYEAPLEELSTEYLVKKKTIDWYISPNKLFYTYELSSNFNSENAINYFDNQRAKNQGNIGEGETITRNIDLESQALIIFYDTEIEEVQVENPTSLDFELDGVLI